MTRYLAAPVEIDARAAELLGGRPGVVEFARSTARAALAERGPASDVARPAADSARPPLGLVDVDAPAQ